MCYNISMNNTKKTLCLLKSDLVHRNLIGSAISAIEAKFTIEHFQMKKLTKNEVEQFYVEHKEKSFFSTLANNVMITPVVIIIISGGENIVKEFRDYLGATDPSKSANKTLRQRFALSIDANSFHGSDSDISAAREIELLLPGYLN